MSESLQNQLSDKINHWSINDVDIALGDLLKLNKGADNIECELQWIPDIQLLKVYLCLLSQDKIFNIFNKIIKNWTPESHWEAYFYLAIYKWRCWDFTEAEKFFLLAIEKWDVKFQWIAYENLWIMLFNNANGNEDLEKQWINYILFAIKLWNIKAKSRIWNIYLFQWMETEFLELAIEAFNQGCWVARYMLANYYISKNEWGTKWKEITLRDIGKNDIYRAWLDRVRIPL